LLEVEEVIQVMVITQEVEVLEVIELPAMDLLHYRDHHYFYHLALMQLL
jgi:hypothetical protein